MSERAPLPFLSLAYLPGVGIIWKDPLPTHYRQAIWHLRNSPPFTRDYALIERLEATARKIAWRQACRER
jgi:hypothetical protein